MNSFFEAIATSVRNYFPQVKKVIYPARIDDEGRVLVQSSEKQNEFVYAGIKDNEGDYAYIRHRDSGEIIHRPLKTAKTMSCNHTVMETDYNLRIVLCLRNWCPYNAEDNLRRALMKADFPNIDDNWPPKQVIRNAEAVPIRSVIDSITILKEESPKAKQFDKNLMFVAIDFDLTLQINYF